MNTSEMKIVQTRAVYNRLLRDTKGWLKKSPLCRSQGCVLCGDRGQAIHCLGVVIPLPTPKPGFCTMPPRGGPLIPPLGPPRGPPGPRRRLSLRSPSLAARVFFSSTFRRTVPRNMMGCEEQGEQALKLLIVTTQSDRATPRSNQLSTHYSSHTCFCQTSCY